MSTVRSLDVAVRANTQNFETGMRNVSKIIKGTIVGINAVAAAAAGQEKSFLQIANSLAIGFATGGPLGLALAGAGVGLGLIIGKAKEAEEQWRTSMQSMRSETEALEKTAKQTADRLFELQGGDILAREIDAATKRLADAQAAYDAALANAPPRGGGLIGAVRDMVREKIEGPSEVDRTQAVLEEQLKQLDALKRTFRDRAQIEGIEAAADGLKKVKDAATETGFAVQFAARSLSDLIAGVIVDGAKAVDVLRSIARSAASIGIQRGVNAAFGIATP